MSIHIPGVCADCGGRTSERVYTRCRACSDAALHAAGLARRWTCPRCGGRKSPNGTICQPCVNAARAAGAATRPDRACPECGGPKHCRSAICQACDTARRTFGPEWHGVLRGFDPAAFRALIAHADLEWTPRLLAAASGVAESTIAGWVRGSARPRAVEFGLVAAVLALEACRACGGSGMVDGERPETPMVSRPPSPPRSRRHADILAGAPVRIGGRTLIAAGGLTFDLTARTVAGPGGQVLLATPTEWRILLALTERAGFWVSSAELAELAIGAGSSTQSVRVHLSRLYPRLAALGARDAIENRAGYGYRMAADEPAEERKVRSA